MLVHANVGYCLKDNTRIACGVEVGSQFSKPNVHCLSNVINSLGVISIFFFGPEESF